MCLESVGIYFRRNYLIVLSILLKMVYCKDILDYSPQYNYWYLHLGLSAFNGCKLFAVRDILI